MGKLVLSLPPAYALPILVTQVIIPVDPGAPADLTFPRKVFLGNKEVYVALLSLKLSVCLACHFAISILQGTDPFIVQKDGLQFGQAILVRSKHWMAKYSQFIYKSTTKVEENTLTFNY